MYLALQEWKALTALMAVSIFEYKIISHWKPSDFLQKSRKESIQIELCR